MAYLLDTNIFNQLVDNRISIDELPQDDSLLATYLQIEEINKTNNQNRKDELLKKFHEVNPKRVPVETALFDATPWNEGKYGGDSELYKELLIELDAMNNKKANNYADVLIAEVIIQNGHTLITADQDLADLVENRNGKLIRFPA
ncbi:hypothetical protein [Zwartia panacis]|uniref:hypothetical protein n=1 Tax=Zwartia panacis TaxID=2683345 RepID=UPI0025B412FD|nr:hypothetical protein [Zwartia panacis]MDN4017149.1 hypothetical protein [Zwartia panacis]